MCCRMVKSTFLIILLVAFFRCTYINCVTVCDDFKHYISPNNEHCYNNSDGERNMTEIIKNWSGVSAEEHNIYTEDGYQILVVRAYSSSTDKDPIVLGSGIFLSPLTWVNRGEKSLAKFLIKQGHEVWIINFRGSGYSRGHKTLTTSDNAYWNYSFSEMGIYDLSSTLQLVMKVCNKKAIYVGHSVGATVGYVYGITKSNDAQSYLKGMISLAPIAYLDGIKSYLRFLLPVAEYLKPLVYQTTHGRVPLSYVYGLLNCSSLLDMYLVELLKVPFYGEDLDQIDPLNLPITEVQNRPNDVAVDILVHLSQIMLSKKFQCRDFGKDANLKKYNQEKPPKMLLGSIPVPVTLFVGNNDWFASKNNARRLYNELKASNQCGFNVIAYDKWNHRDFILAKDITKLLYDPLYKAITSMCKGVCMK